VCDYALRRFRDQFGPDAPLPEPFVTAQDLTPAEHIRMQAAVQRHVDSAISKTVNLPEDMPFEAFQHVYWHAYRSGCKGCTTYRPNPVTGAVLEANRVKAAAPPTTIHNRRWVCSSA
jgi:ribonucleoside-diphosphate reductase alpha chain